jgi:hypothetical protein
VVIRRAEPLFCERNNFDISRDGHICSSSELDCRFR